MPQPSSRIHVLVVDDSATTGAQITDLLCLVPDMQVIGYTSSGEAAIIQAVQFQPDVVLLDLTLPERDSLEVIATLHNRLPTTRIVGMSQAGAAHSFSFPVPPNVRALVIKPITAAALSKAIRYARHYQHTILL